MVSFTSLTAFVTLAAVVMAATTPAKRTIASDLSWIASETSEFAWTLSEWGPNPPNNPPLQVPTASYVHNCALNLEAAYSSITPDMTGSAPLDDADAQSILSTFNTSIVAVQASVTQQLIEFQSIFAAIQGEDWPATYLQDQIALKASTSTYLDALNAKLPSDLVDEGAALTAAALSNFDEAIAAYQF